MQLKVSLRNISNNQPLHYGVVDKIHYSKWMKRMSIIGLKQE